MQRVNDTVCIYATTLLFSHTRSLRLLQALQKLEAKVKKSREEGQRPENKSKNRYKNILPCESFHLSQNLPVNEAHLTGTQWSALVVKTASSFLARPPTLRSRLPTASQWHPGHPEICWSQCRGLGLHQRQLCESKLSTRPPPLEGTNAHISPPFPIGRQGCHCPVLLI